MSVHVPLSRTSTLVPSGSSGNGYAAISLPLSAIGGMARDPEIRTGAGWRSSWTAFRQGWKRRFHARPGWAAAGAIGWNVGAGIVPLSAIGAIAREPDI